MIENYVVDVAFYSLVNSCYNEWKKKQKKTFEMKKKKSLMKEIPSLQ